MTFVSLSNMVIRNEWTFVIMLTHFGGKGSQSCPNNQTLPMHCITEQRGNFLVIVISNVITIETTNGISMFQLIITYPSSSLLLHEKLLVTSKCDKVKLQVLIDMKCKKTVTLIFL